MITGNAYAISVKMTYSFPKAVSHMFVRASFSADDEARFAKCCNVLPLELLKEVLDANQTMSVPERNVMRNAFEQYKAMSATHALDVR
jgi:hypothetical protein